MLKKGPTTAMARHVKQEDYSSRTSAPKEIGLEVVDPKTRKKYIRGKFLGKVSNKILKTSLIFKRFWEGETQRHTVTSSEENTTEFLPKISYVSLSILGRFCQVL